VNLKQKNSLRYRNIPTDTKAQEYCNIYSFVLDQLYPGYAWQVMMIQDVVNIKNLTLHTELGITKLLSEIYDDFRKLERFGGELLESFGVSRGRRIKGEVEALPKDIRRNTIPVR
jgi:hypothetical protein